MSPVRRVPRIRRDITRKALTARARAENAAAREQRVLLVDMKRAILRQIVDADGYRRFHLQSLLSSIDQEIRKGREAAQRLSSAQTRAVWQAGVEGIDRTMATVGIQQPSFVGVGPNLLSASIEVTNDQLRSVWSELGSRLKATVRRATLGVTDPFTAMTTLARTIKDPKTFGTAMNRAEVIIRTEVNRTFSLSTQSRMEQANQRLGGELKKYWLTAQDARVRESHVRAGELYAPGGETGPIDTDKPFMVGDVALMQPLDPTGPAEETINCRCVSVPWLEDLAVAQAA